MEYDRLPQIRRLEVRLSEAEQLLRSATYKLDKLIKAHNELFEAHVRLLKSYNDNSEYVGGVLDDLSNQSNMVIDRILPEHAAFQRDVSRIFKKNDDNH